MPFSEIINKKLLYKTVSSSAVDWEERIVNEWCFECEHEMSFCYKRERVTVPRFFQSDSNDNSIALYGGNCPKCGERHYAVFVNDGSSYQSIGFYPGIFSRIESIDIYDKVLSDKQQSDLIMAIRSGRLGMYAGSFVYFRRLLESLVESILNNKECEKTGFNEKLRCAEEIVSLFPEDFDDIKGSFYKFISEGIHKWTDEECSRQYPLAEYAVTRILDHYKQKKENENRNKELRKVIGENNNSKRK